jgi:hypothetical protein
MSWVLSCETSTSKVLIFFCCGEGNIISCDEWRVWDGLSRRLLGYGAGFEVWDDLSPIGEPGGLV